MKRDRSARFEIAAALLAAAIALFAAFDLVGKTFKAVNALTIVALSIAAGIGMARAMAKLRAEKAGRQLEEGKSR